VEKLLEVKDLKTQFFTYAGVVKAVNGISFDIMKGEAVGLVGESGCGKTVTGLSIMRLISYPPGKIDIWFNYLYGKDLLSLSEKEMREIRGGEISMIFQDPMTSLNPVLTIGEQIIEVLTLHKNISREDAKTRQ